MKWSATYATGIERIDEQHRALFRMSEDYRTALGEGSGQRVYGIVLDFLDKYARAHFADEEGCMARFQCPYATQNSRSHAEFVEMLGAFKRLYATRGFDPDDALRLVDTIDHWLSSHIARIDVHLKPCVENA